MKINSIHNYNNFKINFSAKNQIVQNEPQKPFEKYGIDISKMPVVCDDDVQIPFKTKEMLVLKIIEAHELAKKNCNWGNISKSAYATNIGLENGSWHCATNFNNTRNEISAICGERSAILGAFNDLLKSKPVDNNIKAPLDFSVKYLAMSSSKPLGEDKNAASPCGDCLSWLKTTRFFNDDTIIASLEKNPQTSEFLLRLTKLKNYLPYRNEINVANEVDFAMLPFKFTNNARQSLRKKGLTQENLEYIISKTKEKYDQNAQTQISGQNIATGILANGELFLAQKIDYSKRWFQEPLLLASSKAIEKFGQDTKIDLVCYVGDSLAQTPEGLACNDGVINLSSIGKIGTKFADKETILISNTKDSIQVRTIDDYVSQQYKFHQNYKIL